MTIKEFTIKLFTPNGGISSKRFFGAIGWMVCLSAALYCTIHGIQAPLFLDSVIYASAALLGVDSITDIWKKKKTS